MAAPTPQSLTMAGQGKLPKLPVPPLKETLDRYLRALEGLQDHDEHDKTREAVKEFLDSGIGPNVQQRLVDYAAGKFSYIEEFWYESYLSHTDPVVLSLNPYFVLENDPSPSRSSQVPRAASLIISSLGFIHDLRKGILEPDKVRGTVLDMDQYTRLFGTARIPTETGCVMETNAKSKHMVVLRRGQFYWFDVLDEDDRPLHTERDVIKILNAIVRDADKVPREEVARTAIGLLSTENRKIWSRLRNILKNASPGSLEVVDKALFVVCLDDVTPRDTAHLCENYLCGTYELAPADDNSTAGGGSGGARKRLVQVGSCLNRWYDKLQIIVCADGSAGINFEHTGVDGHTVLRFAADVFTQGLMLIAKSINPSAPTLFKAELSPSSKSYKPPRGAPKSNGTLEEEREYTVTPKKLIWNILDPSTSALEIPSPSSPTHSNGSTSSPSEEEQWKRELRIGIRYAETRLSDLICQNECSSLEFTGYGKGFMTQHGFSPDAFVQMAFQAAYFGLYGRVECVYEPAMTKAFLHGRTEAIRSVQPESVAFTKMFYTDATMEQKVGALRRACERHTKLTKECSAGLGQDRHLYALYCLLRKSGEPMPKIFNDAGWALLNTSILSTSNCGNPALRLFGFGPVAADGYGIGYIIKEDGISVCASSKHLQTFRWLDTLEGYLLDIQRLIIQLDKKQREVNLHESAPWLDHEGILRDARTGRRVSTNEREILETPQLSEDEEDEDLGALGSGYSFFENTIAADVDLMLPSKKDGKGQGRRRPGRYANVGTVIPFAEY